MCGTLYIVNCTKPAQLMCYPGTASMHVDLKFNLILEWFDHKVSIWINFKSLEDSKTMIFETFDQNERLDHKVDWVNLKAEEHLNTLSSQELDMLWLPKVI